MITIRSRDLDNLHPYGSQGNLTLFQSIQSEPDEVLTVQVISAVIPNSWNNLSTVIGNNKLRFAEFLGEGDSSETTLTVSDGNYSIDELMSSVKTLLDGSSSNGCKYTLTYSEITNQVSITHDKTSTVTTTFDFLSSDTIRRFLGFTQGEFSITGSEPIVKSDRTVDITDTHNAVFIRSDLNNQKVVESSSTRPSNIIACIPVPLSRNSFFVYDPMQPFEIQLSQAAISSINLRVTWQDERLIDLRKADWELTLKINYRRLPKAERFHFRKHNDIESRLRKFEAFQKTIEMDDSTKAKIRDSVTKNLDIEKANEGNVSDLP